MKIEFCKHNINEEDIKELNNTLNSFFITTSSKTELFEKEFSKYTRNNFTLGLTSCTAGLFLLLKALNLPENSEVIVPALSFCASANTIIHAGHIPVFADVEANTGNISALEIEEKITQKTRAIMVVHLYGQMCDMNAIKILSDKYKLAVIEDSAHCVEGERDRVKPGNLSTGAAFSFYATKNLTSGEGGAVTVNDEELYIKLKTMRLHGLTHDAHNRYNAGSFSQYNMEIPGYKYNMFDIQSALLINQLKRIDETLKRRKEIFEIYNNAFKDYVTIPELIQESKHAHHLYTIWVNKKKRNSTIDKLFADGVPVSVHFYPIHLLDYYRKAFNYKEGDFPVSEDISAKTITLPFYPKLNNEEIDYIIDKTLKYIKS